MARMKTVQVHRDGKVYKRKQPLHHRINKGTMRRELKRLSEQREVIEENMQRAKRRAREAIG